MASLRRLWRGELPLKDAFWNWAVAGGLVVNALSSVAFLFLVADDHLLAAYIAGYAPSLPYNVIVTIGVWRAAVRYEGERRWADFARIVTVIGMIILSVT
jgi:hypothetical protein